MQHPMQISEFAPTLADLQKLSLERQSHLFLARLAVLYKWNPNNCPTNKNNLRLRPGFGLTQGYTEEETSGVCDLLLAKPWNELVMRSWIVDVSGGGCFSISPEGMAVVQNQQFVPLSRDALGAVELLHPDLASVKRQFREGDFKPAIAAASLVFENRLNRLRDTSGNANVATSSGPALVRDLYRFKILKFPFPELPVAWQPRAEDGLKNVLSGALGLVRNPYVHTPESLPDLDEKSSLELLFFISLLLRMIDLST
jgi:Protein of unknown function (Hypoth_ymh)